VTGVPSTRRFRACWGGLAMLAAPESKNLLFLPTANWQLTTALIVRAGKRNCPALRQHRAKGWATRRSQPRLAARQAGTGGVSVSGVRVSQDMGLLKGELLRLHIPVRISKWSRRLVNTARFYRCDRREALPWFADYLTKRPRLMEAIMLLSLESPRAIIRSVLSAAVFSTGMGGIQSCLGVPFT
jgi:hypothetical protein